MSTDNSSEGGEALALLAPEVVSGRESLPFDLCLRIHRLMVRARAMEERMIKMSKSGLGYFWIGGPGEEAFNACLGLQIKKGQGPEYDYLHLHYRNSATLLAMGMPVSHGLRQMAMTATDTHSRGRNFAGHFASREWNVIPVTSVIEVQYVMAPGTALVQKRIPGNDALSIVTGGDAGTAEGDFASCMVWSTRPGNELPVLMIVTNNQWGISTHASTQHGERNISDRGKAFGMRTAVVNGNDVIASWHAINRAMDYVRRERKPFLLEAHVSRLHGHSSSSGANRVRDEADPILLFESRLFAAGVLDPHQAENIREEEALEVERVLEEVLAEAMPTADDVEKFTYAPSLVDDIYPGDYTGLPH